MNIFKKILFLLNKSSKNISNQPFDIERVLTIKDQNKCIIEIDNYICELSSWGSNLERLTDQQKNFLYNQNLEREVNNGGFKQFFYNSSGEFAHETINSLKIIGAHKTATIVQEAINQFPNNKIPKDRIERINLIENLSENVEIIWDELDQKFFIYEEDLNSLNIEYIKQNISNFDDADFQTPI